MTRDICASLSGKKDILIDEGATTFSVNGVLSRGGSSQLLAYNLRRQQLLENRFKQEIVCKFYDSQRNNFITFNGVILTESKNGLSFLAKNPCEVETPVFIKRKTPRHHGCEDVLNDGKHAQIISCNNAGNQNDKNRYHFSALYFEVCDDTSQFE